MIVFIKPTNPCFQDLTGQRFGRLVAIKYFGKAGTNSVWLCACDCGNSKAIMSTHLTRGRIVSCRCYQREVVKKQNGGLRKHGMCGSPEYKTWSSMKHRCKSGHPFYGGRGISVCGRWKDSFACFFEDMGPRPEGHTLDRINVDGDYEPENCRWADNKTQSLNRRTTVHIEFRGETHTMQEWSEITGIPYNTIQVRNKRGWPSERVLNERY